MDCFSKAPTFWREPSWSSTRRIPFGYLQITPELTQLPDMEEAFAVAKSLITAS